MQLVIDASFEDKTDHEIYEEILTIRGSQEMGYFLCLTHDKLWSFEPEYVRGTDTVNGAQIIDGLAQMYNDDEYGDLSQTWTIAAKNLGNNCLEVTLA